MYCEIKRGLIFKETSLICFHADLIYGLRISVRYKTFHTEAELATLAKRFRIAAKRSRAQAARELSVAAPTVHQAEENPELPLGKLRRKIIEKYSSFKIIGPVYRLQKK